MAKYAWTDVDLAGKLDRNTEATVLSITYMPLLKIPVDTSQTLDFHGIRMLLEDQMLVACVYQEKVVDENLWEHQPWPCYVMY
jgi:hypothetical protein